VELTVGHLAQVVSEVDGPAVEVVEGRRPGGRHAPTVDLAPLGLGEHQGGQAGAGGDHAGLLQEITTLHARPPSDALSSFGSLTVYPPGHARPAAALGIPYSAQYRSMADAPPPKTLSSGMSSLAP